MINDENTEFASGDAVLVIGGPNDGKVGTVLRRRGDDYLVVLEDGVEVVLRTEDLSLRQ
jgi:ribosomal protein L24